MIVRSLDEKSATGSGSLNSFDWWTWAHQEQLRLCDELEQIADSLPMNVSRQKCIYAAKALGPLIKGVHHYEDSVLFPKIEAAFSSLHDVKGVLSRLRCEHFEDECLAEELSERLLQLGAGRSDVNMEATGYMLRGFFDAIRRHVAYEQNYFAAFMTGGRLDGECGTTM